MLRRSSEAAAATGAHVFPGGGVDAVDAEVVARGLVSGLDAPGAARRLDLSRGALAYYCAALRELFEEAGLLLVVDASGHAPSLAAAQVGAWREELRGGQLGWAEFLEREGLRLALGEMHYVAHWVTPDTRPRRFDTRFFLAVAPAGQRASADGVEVTDHVWTTASEALARFRSAQWAMLVPTVRTLMMLSPWRSRQEVIDRIATLEVTRTQPRELEREGRVVVVVPGEDDYDDP